MNVEVAVMHAPDHSGLEFWCWPEQVRYFGSLGAVFISSQSIYVPGAVQDVDYWITAALFMGVVELTRLEEGLPC